MFDEGENLLPQLLPDERDLADVVKVIAANQEDEEQIFSVMMDSDEEKAVGFLG